MATCSIGHILPSPASNHSETPSSHSTKLGAYVGHYAFPIGRDTNPLVVTQQREALMMYNAMGKRRLRLWPSAPDTVFDANNGATYLFERDAESRVKSIRLGLAPDAQRAVRK